MHVHRVNLNAALDAHALPETPTGKATVTADGGEFTDIQTDQPISADWSHVFLKFKLEPTEFEIVDDTVRMSTWQQSKATDDGKRDLVQLYSYSARFRRRTRDSLPVGVVDEWRKALLRKAPRPKTPIGGRGTYMAAIADPQFGKKGTEEAIRNYKRGVLRHCTAIRQMITAGRAPEAVHIAYQGDETEGVANNYANQPHTIELNQSQQLTLDYDMRVWTIEEFAQFGLPLSVSSVVSNHGEWTRNGGKEPITSRADNASTFIARQVKALFDKLEPHTGLHIDWHIGDAGQPGVTVTLSGVECYFSHGYVEKGKGATTESRVKGAIERQILGSTERLGTTRLWFMAHYHHFHAQEFEGRTLFGCPALEALRSSEYMLDQFGVWSPPGVLGLLIDSTVDRGWTDLAVY